MKKRTMISGAAALILSVYSLIAWNTVRGLKIYTVSYAVGRWLPWSYIVAGCAALATWIVFVVFVLKDKDKIKEFFRQMTAKLFVKAQTEEKTQKTKAGLAQEPLEMPDIPGMPDISEPLRGEEASEAADVHGESETDEPAKEPVTADGILAEERFCKACGEEIKPEHKFCPRCGTELTQED